MVEKRKIIKFGSSSYVVTIPTEWMERNKLKKGDEINLSKSDDSLIFSLNSEITEKKAIIELNNKPLKIFNRELISYYLKNYKFIEVRGDNVLERIEQIKVFQEKLSSVEIVEINEKKIVLKDLTSPEELKLNKILTEIINMEQMLFSQVIKKSDPDKKYQKHQFITQLDSNINKLTFLAYKSINYNLDRILDPIQVKSSIHYWRIVSSLESIGDIIKRIARYLRNAEDKQEHEINNLFIQVENYFTFITSLLNLDVNLDNNLKLALDRKQSLLKEFEKIKEGSKNDLNLYLVISQLFKDILGQLDTVILSIIDIKTK